MKTKLVIALTFLASFSFAQATFEKTFGTTGDNFANDVQLTSDGGYIIAGTGNFNSAGSDIFLIKTDSKGDTLWTRFIGGGSTDYGNAVAPTTDGGYIIAGSTMSFGAGASDAFLVKTDVNGNVTWSKTYGTASNDAAYGVVQTADGGYVFSGTEMQSGLNGKAHLVKVDANGNVLWSKTFGNSTRKNFAYTLQQTADRGFIIGGWENLNLGINDDFCLIKTDSNGVKEWYKSYGDVGHDQNYSVHQTVDGGFIMAGITFSATVFDVNMVKTDASGNLVWTKNFGGSGADDAYAVTSTSDGGFVFCGSTSSFGLNQAAYLVKVDGSGNLLWSRTMSGSGWDGFFAIHEAVDGGLIMAGVKGETYGVSGSLYLVKTDANGNSGCNSGVTSSFTVPSILVGTPTAIGTSTQTVGNVAPTSAKGTVIATICSSCIPVPWYQDADADGYGNPLVLLSSCTQPSGYVADNTDCNDANATIHPNAADLCNAIDDNCNGVTDENAITATITPSGSVSTCSGVNITLSANTGSGISYQWKRGNNNIAGATNPTYSTNKAASYKVFETNSFNCSATSAATIVSVLSSPSAMITAPNGTDLCPSGSVMLQANSGAGLTYQWMKGATNISNATNQYYTATAKGTYKVIVTGSNGCSKTSPGVKVVKTCKEENVLNSDAYPMELSLYPNPTSGSFTIDLKIAEKSSNNCQVLVLNMVGRVVYQENIAVADGSIHQEIDLDNSIADGLYIVRLILNDKEYSGRIVYQK